MRPWTNPPTVKANRAPSLIRPKTVQTMRNARRNSRSTSPSLPHSLPRPVGLRRKTARVKILRCQLTRSAFWISCERALIKICFKWSPGRGLNAPSTQFNSLTLKSSKLTPKWHVRLPLLILKLREISIFPPNLIKFAGLRNFASLSKKTSFS